MKYMSLVGLAAAGLLAAAPVAAQAPAEFYKGKTVTILVGSPPGGGYDAYARMLAPHFAKRTGTQVVIENRPGGSGLLALNVLYASRPDGLTLMHASAEGAIMSQLTQREGARWDVAKLNWLARTGAEPKLWFFSAKSKLGSIADAQAADRVLWSVTGPADNISDVGAVISHALGLKSKFVSGYKGASDMSLAVVNGEVDSGVLSIGSAVKLVQGGQLKPIAIIGRERSPLLPNVPTIFEAAKIPEDKAWWIDFREKIGQPHRAMVAGPGVPADRIAWLRAEWQAVLTDPAVVEEGAKTAREIEFMTGTQLQKLVEDLMGSVSGARLDEVRQVMLKTYF